MKSCRRRSYRSPQALPELGGRVSGSRISEATLDHSLLQSSEDQEAESSTFTLNDELDLLHLNLLLASGQHLVGLVHFFHVIKVAEIDSEDGCTSSPISVINSAHSRESLIVKRRKSYRQLWPKNSQPRYSMLMSSSMMTEDDVKLRYLAIGS